MRNGLSHRRRHWLLHIWLLYRSSRLQVQHSCYIPCMPACRCKTASQIVQRLRASVWCRASILAADGELWHVPVLP